MLDVRPTAYISPLDEQVLDDITPVILVESLGDEPARVTGLVRIYRKTTGQKVFESLLHPGNITPYQSLQMPTESAWSPASPAIDDYFVIAEILATEPAEGHKCRGYLPPFTFEILPGPMGPAPAAHAPTHELGGMDPIPVETLATAARDTGLRLAPDGAGGLTFATGGGSAGTPSDTVTSETSPGQTPNAGASSDYSRGDHTHGTPPTADAEPGGKDTDVQYNDSGSLGGTDSLTFNKSATSPNLATHHAWGYSAAIAMELYGYYAGMQISKYRQGLTFYCDYPAEMEWVFGTTTHMKLQPRGGMANNNPQLGVGVSSPTAVLHLLAGSTVAGTAPLKIDAGTPLTTPEAGAIESDGTHLYWTDSGGSRHQLD